MKQSPEDSPEVNQILNEHGTIKEEWLSLLKKYPDRFMIGSDNFFFAPSSSQQKGPPSFYETWAIADQLPADLRAKVTSKNPVNVFGLE